MRFLFMVIPTSRVRLLLSALLMLCFFLPLHSSETRQVKTHGSLSVGDAAPAFAISLPDQKIISLRSELEHGPLLLVFWARWCEPCKTGLKWIDAWYQSAKTKPRVLCVNFLDDRELGQKTWEELNIDLPVVWDRYGSVGKRYGLAEEKASLPLSLFINQNGELRSIITREGQDIGEVIDALMSESME